MTVPPTMQAFDVEGAPRDLEVGGGDEEHATKKSSSKYFPCQPCKFCPTVVTNFVPNTWLYIQDATHLVLLAGFVAQLVLVLLTVGVPLYKLSKFQFFDPQHPKYGGFMWPADLYRLFVAAPFMYCVLPYTLQLMNSYDQSLIEKQEKAKFAKEKLNNAYNSLLGDMDGLLKKSAESASGLAERSFESKRRDFQRFLERAKHRYDKVFIDCGPSNQSDNLLREFRRFCRNWLKVFEEASIDPVDHPKMVVTADELERCVSIGEIADLCLERLRNTEVQFITMKRDQDTQMLNKTRQKHGRGNLLAIADTAATAVGNTLSMASGRPPKTKELDPATAPNLGENLVEKESKKSSVVSWFTCGKSPCGCESSEQGTGGFPKMCGCTCMALNVLSKEHLQLLTGFILGAALFVVQFILKGESDERAVLVVIIVSMVCVVVMLLRFEEIDVLQRLEREVNEMAQQNKEVEQQRDHMNEFWNNTQNLTELWLYRTVPRLELYKELHSQLEDGEQSDFLVNISGANQWLEDLEGKMGSLEAWRNDGELTTETKKAFGKQINMVCQEQDVAEMLCKLEDVTTHHMRRISDAHVPGHNA